MRIFVRQFRCLATLVLVGAAVVIDVARVQAQVVPPELPAAFTSDSTAWQRVLTYFVGSISGTLVRSAVDPAPQPWQIGLPADEPQRQLIRRQLQTILRARAVREEDSVFYSVDFAPLRVELDTAWVAVRSEMSRRCPGTAWTAGYSNIDSVYVARGRSGAWEVARTRVVVHGDRPACPTASRQE